MLYDVSWLYNNLELYDYGHWEKNMTAVYVVKIGGTFRYMETRAETCQSFA